jgi:HEAT repeat protein
MPAIDRVEQLIKTLGDKNPFMLSEGASEREAAAIELGKIGDRRATVPLIKALEDRFCCFEAALALGKLGDRAAVQPLLKVAQTWISAPHRFAALHALGEMGDVSVLEEIRKCLQDKDKDVREEAAVTIVKLQ